MSSDHGDRVQIEALAQRDLHLNGTRINPQGAID